MRSMIGASRLGLSGNSSEGQTDAMVESINAEFALGEGHHGPRKPCETPWEGFVLLILL